MNNNEYNQVKKEVISHVLGTTIGVRLQGNAPMLFRELYYDRITSKEKKGLIQRVLIEILSEKYTLPHYKLRCFAAYVACDIGLEHAIPFVQQLALMATVQKTSYLLLLERALEKIKAAHEFTREQMMQIVMYKIAGRHEAVHSRGEIIYDFKKEYYESSSSEKKEMIKQALMDILTTNFKFMNRKRIICDAAYIASDIGLTEARLLIDKMISDESFKKCTEYGTLTRALEKLKTCPKN